MKITTLALVIPALLFPINVFAQAQNNQPIAAKQQATEEIITVSKEEQRELKRKKRMEYFTSLPIKSQIKIMRQGLKKRLKANNSTRHKRKTNNT